MTSKLLLRLLTAGTWLCACTSASPSQENLSGAGSAGSSNAGTGGSAVGGSAPNAGGNSGTGGVSAGASPGVAGGSGGGNAGGGGETGGAGGSAGQGGGSGNTSAGSGGAFGGNAGAGTELEGEEVPEKPWLLLCPKDDAQQQCCELLCACLGVHCSDSPDDAERIPDCMPMCMGLSDFRARCQVYHCFESKNPSFTQDHESHCGHASGRVGGGSCTIIEQQ